jgi:hypothetical protein
MKRNSNNEANKMALDNLFRSPDSVIEQAKHYCQISRFQGEDREIPYYYYMLKSLIAQHEARFGTVSIQVFNEHRMALDHFIRASEIGADHKEHVKAAVRHLCRGVLDITKINCEGLRKTIVKRQQSIPKKALGLISNGEYIKKFTEKHILAENELLNARTKDGKFGSNVEINEDVVNNYIRAYIAHLDWYKYQGENFGNALFIRAKYYFIAGWPFWITFLMAIISPILSDTARRVLCEMWNSILSIVK